MTPRVYAIIVAAGRGLRMQDSKRKQFTVLEGKPILAHTLTAFNRCDAITRIIVVLPAKDLEFCRQEILPAAGVKKKTELVVGGARRQDSVYNGLKAIKNDDGLVLIHDGVRPFVRQEHLRACIEGAHKQGACILGVPASDTVKQVNAQNVIVQTRPRNTLWLAQTPQAFEIKLIKKAHASAKQDGFIGTDDASLVERLGAAVKMIPGSRCNIKITRPEDLKLARALLRTGGFED
ncbi:MAG: 2-C-methyl-D-erythritol 4-phosphate cytidylyltransferase [Deltaproteobacteria bacterium]|nr:2-C-methyl-D-erythritol 4-phosphate cytidylyltransferase [Deltaproteobacteria bacterium]